MRGSEGKADIFPCVFRFHVVYFVLLYFFSRPGLEAEGELYALEGRKNAADGASLYDSAGLQGVIVSFHNSRLTKISFLGKF